MPARRKAQAVVREAMTTFEHSGDCARNRPAARKASRLPWRPGVSSAAAPVLPG